MSTPGRYDLERFVTAQAGAFDQACAELAAGAKQSHWLWFMFPQLKGLGSSPTAQYFAIASLDEARAYLAHPVLGPRLEQATILALDHASRPLRQIFGTPVDLKFRSSMTLFAQAAEPGSVYARALERMSGGADQATLRLLAGR